MAGGKKHGHATGQISTKIYAIDHTRLTFSTAGNFCKSFTSSEHEGPRQKSKFDENLGRRSHRHGIFYGKKNRKFEVLVAGGSTPPPVESPQKVLCRRSRTHDVFHGETKKTGTSIFG